MATTPRPGRPHAPRRPDRSSGAGRSRDESARVSSPGRPVKNRRKTRNEADESAVAQVRRNARTSSTRSQRPARPSRPGARPVRDRGRDEERAARKVQRLRDGTSFNVGGIEVSMRLLTVLVLAGLLAALLVPNLYQWWQQEQRYWDIQTKVAAAEDRNAKMRETLDLWNDPEYVASQARERLGYVKPGETQFAVVDPGEDYQDKAQVAAAEDKGTARPWVHVVGILLAEADKADDSQQVAAVDSGHDQSGSQSASQPQSGS